MENPRDVEVYRSDRTGIECLRAVIESRERQRTPALSTVVRLLWGLPWTFADTSQSAYEPRRVRHQRERLARRVHRAGAGETRRQKLVSAAADSGANVYSTSDGTIEELRYFCDKGLFPIVGYFDPTSIPAQSSAANIEGKTERPALPRALTDQTRYAIVTRVDKSMVWLLRPTRRGSTARVTSEAQSIETFLAHWRLNDSMDAKERDALKPQEVNPQLEVRHWYMVLNFENKRFEPGFRKGHDDAAPLLDLRRKRRILSAAFGIFFAEIGLGIFAYADPSSYVFALLSIGLAVFGFTAIDYFARPEQREYTGTLVPRWYRRHLPFWCLVPFLTTLGGSVWVHYQKWNEARADVHQLAQEIKVAVEAPNGRTASTTPTARDPAEDCLAKARLANETASNVLTGKKPPAPSIPVANESFDATVKRAWMIAALAEWQEAQEGLEKLKTIQVWECFTTERVHDRVAALLENRYRDKPSSDEAIRFGQIARVVGHDLMLAKGDVEVVCDRAHRDTASAFALSMGVQALFILWIPALLAVTIARARKRTNREHLRDDVANSMNLRDHAILAEDQYLFLPRMCFAMLLVLGTNYVFAPLGLKSTYIMTLVDEHALPGHTTFTLWTTAFSEAPVIVVGFVGFLLYALITATQRFAQDDFDDRSLLSLLVRGLVVILLSFALSSSEMNEIASRTFVFFAGVFPVRALEAIGQKITVKLDPDFPDVNPQSNFVGLPGLDPVKVFALRTAGIQSTYDLAAMNIKDVAERVRIDPRLLGRSVDRAILIDAVGAKLADRLSWFGITSATELVDTPDLAAVIRVEAARGDETSPDDQKTISNLLGAATLAAQRLKDDARVSSVRGWLASSR